MSSDKGNAKAQIKERFDLHKRTWILSSSSFLASAIVFSVSPVHNFLSASFPESPLSSAFAGIRHSSLTKLRRSESEEETR